MFKNFVQAFTSQKAFFYYGVSFGTWLIIVVVITFASSFVLEHHMWPGIGYGTALWLYVNGKLFEAFIVSVPEVTGLVTINLLTGGMNTYGTGLDFRYPWEQVKDGNYISLRTMKTDDKQETFPCKDGPVVIVKWSLQYRSTVDQLKEYIAVDEETINKGLNEIASGFLALNIRNLKSEDIRKDKNKEVLEKNLLEHFKTTATVPVAQAATSTQKASTTTPLEMFYGIQIILVAVADVDFEEDFQKALTTDRVMKKFKKTAEGMKTGDGSITSKDALDSVLMVAGKGVTKTVSQETKVFDVSPALANVLKTAAEAFTKRSQS